LLVAVYNLMGIFTRPNEMLPRQELLATIYSSHQHRL
jgi:hypothetical protein